MSQYKCSNCNKIFSQLTQDGFCSEPDCYGIGLLEAYQAGSSGTSTASQTAVAGIDYGLCIMLCDASGSMDEPGFSSIPVPRVQLVAKAAAAGIADLFPGGLGGGITKPAEALICVVAFGSRAQVITDTAGRPFLKTVDALSKEFGTREKLASHIEYALTHGAEQTVGRDYTHMTRALQLASQIYESALQGDLSKYGLNGKVAILKHDMNINGDWHQVPNIRIMMYSDGGHNPPPNDNIGLSNPFVSSNISPLLTAFIGDVNSGADQMKELSGTCPTHGLRSYFLINDANRYQLLRGLFRMASGASGFCPSCLKTQNLEVSQVGNYIKT